MAKPPRHTPAPPPIKRTRGRVIMGYAKGISAILILLALTAGIFICTAFMMNSKGDAAVGFGTGILICVVSTVMFGTMLVETYNIDIYKFKPIQKLSLWWNTEI